MKQAIRPAIFKRRQTEPELILCAVRWYLYDTRSRSAMSKRSERYEPGGTPVVPGRREAPRRPTARDPAAAGQHRHPAAHTARVASGAGGGPDLGRGGRPQDPRHLRPLQHHQRTGTARGRRPARGVSGAARTGDAAWRAAPPGPAPPAAPRRPFVSCDAPPRKRTRGTSGETGPDTTDATGTSPSRNVSANGAATCVKR